LQPLGTSFVEYRDSLVAWATKAKQLGFAAGKMEVTLSGPYNHSGLDEPDSRITEVVSACRDAVGPDFVMMVDVQYTWRHAEQALETLNTWRDLDIYFVETPLQIDNLAGYAQLHQQAPMPIAAGEWQTTRHEFRELLDVGLVDVAQPDVGRVGGLTEARRVAEMAAERDRRIVPHCWKTGIGISASVQLAAVTAHCPFVEFMPAELCDSLLRQDLLREEMQLVDGVLPLPTRPGLGVELNPDAVQRFRVA
jgi:L-alanine-DL-glutamate epimerase-like enolase superfamily enzyme